MKPRSDSKLKNLPPERQEQIMAWARAPKTEDSPGGLQHAREQLAADGIKVSLRALSEFCSWYSLQERFTAASERAKQFEELLATRDPSLSPEAIRELGQALFTMEAVQAGDAATFVSLESLALAQRSATTRATLEREKLALAERRVRVAERKLDDLKGILTDGALTPEQREQKMRQQFGLA